MALTWLQKCGSACLILGFGSIIYLSSFKDLYAGRLVGFFSALSFSAKFQTDNNSFESSQNSLSQHMKKRLELGSRVCSRLRYDDHLQNIVEKSKNYQPKTWFIPKYNISYCIAGKTANTFIKHLFTSIVLGDEILADLETGPRGAMHEATHKFMVKYKTSSWRRSSLIITVRNPYTRLYSAYVDRVSIPSLSGSVRRGGYCKFDVSFPEFLQIILNNTERGKLDLHWSPIYLICRPCDTKPTYIIKQESLMDDIKFVINSLNITVKTRKALERKLQEPSTNWTITGIVKNTFEKASKSFTKVGCIGWLGAMKRLWRAFQIQGYIDEHLDIPLQLYNETARFSNADLFVKIILNTITEHPLTKEMKKSQRQRALVNAYKQVNKQTIERIKLLYRPDFDMFGYSDEPPS